MRNPTIGTQAAERSFVKNRPEPNPERWSSAKASLDDAR
jgi:hypothetical protein